MFRSHTAALVGALLLVAGQSWSAPRVPAPAAPGGNDLRTIQPKQGRGYLRRGAGFDEGQARFDGYTLVQGHWMHTRSGKRSYRRQHVRALSKPPLRFELSCGDSIPAAANRLADIAKATGRPAAVMTNGYLLEAKPGQSGEKALAKWEHRTQHSRKARFDKRQIATAARAYARRQQRAARLLARAPQGKFVIRDEGSWARQVQLNDGWYGKGILTVAKRWAELMQGEIDKASRPGKPADVHAVLGKHAQRLFRLANVEHLSGAAGAAARGVLVSAWMHGAALAQAMP